MTDPDPKWRALPPPPVYRDRDPMMPEGEPASWPVLALLATGVAGVLTLFWALVA